MSAQTNMPSPDSPNNNKMPSKSEDFTALPYARTDSKSRVTPSQYAAVSDSILSYANKAHDMVLGPSVEKNIKSRSLSAEDQAREMIGAGIPNYSFDKKSSLLGTPLKTTTTTTTTSLSTSIDRNMTHSPTLYDSIATDNPAVAFGEPEDDMAMFEVQKYRATHPWKHTSHPLDTHLMDVIADTRINNGGFDEAEDNMAMYEASKYHSLDATMDKSLDKPTGERTNQMVDPTWINVE